MPPGTLRLVAVLGAVLVGAVGSGGCREGSSAPAPAVPIPSSATVEWPRPGAKTLAELRRGLGPGLELAPGVAVLEPGRNRFGFALFDRARRQVSEAPTALYVAPAGGADDVRGPFRAHHESLQVRPQFQSRSVATDPDGARSVYTAQVPLAGSGPYEVMAVVKLDDRLVATDPVPVRATRANDVPDVGEQAPRIDTPTRESVGGAVETIETRDPPDSMHETNFAEIAGRKPAVLLFSTPALCKSRVCGPVNDVAEQVKADHGDEVEFIHMEIYADNRLEAGLRPQVKRFGLPTEPWAFAVDRRGRVAARLEGAFSVRELEAAVRKAKAP